MRLTVKDFAFLMLGMQATCFVILALGCFALWTLPEWYLVRWTIVFAIILGISLSAAVEAEET